jgi:hypothetical protein
VGGPTPDNSDRDGRGGGAGGGHSSDEDQRRADVAQSPRKEAPAPAVHVPPPAAAAIAAAPRPAAAAAPISPTSPATLPWMHERRATGRRSARGGRVLNDAFIRRFRVAEVRSIHWFPYDRVGVVDADP